MFLSLHHPIILVTINSGTELGIIREDRTSDKDRGSRPFSYATHFITPPRLYG
jgi:hypothetical protein